MTYWPQPFQAAYHQMTIAQHGQASPSSTIGSLGAPSSSGVGALTEYATPFRIARPMMVRTAFWMNGATVLGNIIMGIYDQAGTKLVETASTAQTTINVIQSVAIGPTYLLPGAYYCALIPSDAGALFRAASLVQAEAKHLGYQREDQGSHALPATLNLAAGASNGIWLFGLSTQTVV